MWIFGMGEWCHGQCNLSHVISGVCDECGGVGDGRVPEVWVGGCDYDLFVIVELYGLGDCGEGEFGGLCDCYESVCVDDDTWCSACGSFEVVADARNIPRR